MRQPPPLLGEHTSEILIGQGFGQERIATLTATGCNSLAGGDDPAEDRQLDHKAMTVKELCTPYLAQGEDNAFGSFPNHWKHLFEDSDITPHVLRHSFASIANDLGFTEVTIAALVGHAKGSVTSKYIHTLDTALIMAADTISGYIQGLLDGI